MSEELKKEKKDKREATRMAIEEITHSNAVYVLAFAVPLIIMIAIYIMRKIHPFGDNIYLRSDMYHQYAPFFSELWEKIRSGGSLQYTWDIGMGTNFLAVFGYYLSSPSNWFIALFPQKNVLMLMDFIIVLKIAASALTCTIYLCSHKKEKNISAAIFGMFYALCGFTTAYSWNLMWLDCVLLLPLIALGLEKLVNEGKGLLYVITLGLAILSNYYIAIMICISMVIYFVINMISRPVPQNKIDYVKATLRFIFYSLLAGAFSAVLLLPEMAALEYTASSNINFPKVLDRYFSFVTMFKRHLINVDVHTGLDHYPNIYCGVAVFILAPLYILTKKISKREKITKVIGIFIFLTAFNMNIPNFIWHGFHYPNSLPCRQSFIYVFLLLSICYDAIYEIHDFSNKELSGSLWGALIFFIYLGNSLASDDVVKFNSIYTSALFIGIYALLMYIIRKHKKFTCYLIIVVFAVSIVEVTMNTEHTGYSTTGYSSYFRDYNGVKNVIDDVTKNDDSFYRISKMIGYRSKNDATWHNFKSTSTFSSTAYAGLTNFYGQLGLEHSTNSYAINGATPVIYSIFNVKYLLTNKHLEESDVISYYNGNDGEFLYKNNYVLPLGFMVPSTLEDNLSYKTESNPFIVQNNFVFYSAGIEDVFSSVYMDHVSNEYSFTPDEDTYLYVYIQNKSVENITVKVNDKTHTYAGIKHGRTVDIGYVKAGSTVTLFDADHKYTDLQLLSYTMDEAKYIEAMKKLSANGLEITSYDDTHINGTITADTSGVMFTSIPYDKSWTVYVDGVKTKTSSLGKAFMTVPVTTGTHTIKMVYQANGYKPGLILTIISMIIIGFLIFFRVKFKQEFSEDGSIELMMKKANDKKIAKKANSESEENKQ